MKTIATQNGTSFYLLNGDCFAEHDISVFEQYAKQPQNTNQLGRGTAYLFSYGTLTLVLRQYRRGGLFRHILKNQYFFTQLERTRMWQEFQLLDQLRSLDLPVPVPIAARCTRTSIFTYTGDLITQMLDNKGTLGESLQSQPMQGPQWRTLGETIAQFHSHRTYHADLNANNILLGTEKPFYLIDFDKGNIRPTLGPWAKNNLDRLLRSLEKLQTLNTRFYFQLSDWQNLLAGYNDYLAAVKD